MADIASEFESNIEMELNSSKFIGIKKRLKNELLELHRQDAYVTLDCVKHPSETYFEVTIIPHNKTEVFSFTILRDYPFKPPKNIKLNFENYYSSFLKINSQNTMKEVKKYFKMDCLCCGSITCSANWTPSIRLRSIIDEFYMFKELRRNIINQLLAKKIFDKYLISSDPGFYNYFCSFLIHIHF